MALEITCRAVQGGGWRGRGTGGYERSRPQSQLVTVTRAGPPRGRSEQGGRVVVAAARGAASRFSAIQSALHSGKRRNRSELRKNAGAGPDRILVQRRSCSRRFAALRTPSPGRCLATRPVAGRRPAPSTPVKTGWTGPARSAVQVGGLLASKLRPGPATRRSTTNRPTSTIPPSSPSPRPPSSDGCSEPCLAAVASALIHPTTFPPRRPGALFWRRARMPPRAARSNVARRSSRDSILAPSHSCFAGGPPAGHRRRPAAESSGRAEAPGRAPQLGPRQRGGSRSCAACGHRAQAAPCR